jgi:hypothetical protein
MALNEKSFYFFCEVKMTIRVVETFREREKSKVKPSVTIMPRIYKLMFNAVACNLLRQGYGNKVEVVQLLVDDNLSGIFWIKPVSSNEKETRRLVNNGASVKGIYIKELLEEFNWGLKDSSRYVLTWDEKMKAGRVDTKRPVKITFR